jgi:hypothetical protein
METLTLARIDGETIALVAIVGGLGVAALGILVGTIGSVVRTRTREATKREVSAYVAEGSMSPEDAERIIKADKPRWER